MRNHKRILLHLTARCVGGVESHVVELAKLYATAGHEVVLTSHRSLVFRPEIDEELHQLGVRLCKPPLTRSAAGLVAARAAMLTKLKSRSFDLVVGQGHGRAFGWLRRFVSERGQFVWHEHWDGLPTHGDCYPAGYSRPPAAKLDARFAALVRSVDGILVDSERARRNLQAVQNIRGLPIRVIRPLTKVYESPSDLRKYERGASLQVIMIARHGFGKGSTVLSELWPKLHQIKPADLHLWGSFEDTLLEKEVHDIAATATDIHLRGPFPTSALPRIVAEADLGLMLSVEEGYGLVVCEYMSGGLPFLMTDVGASEEFCDGNADGRCIPVSISGIEEGLEDMTQRIREGRTSRGRLIERFRDRHDPALSHEAYMTLLERPEMFWRGAAG